MQFRLSASKGGGAQTETVSNIQHQYLVTCKQFTRTPL